MALELEERLGSVDDLDHVGTRKRRCKGRKGFEGGVDRSTDRQEDVDLQTAPASSSTRSDHPSCLVRPDVSTNLQRGRSAGADGGASGSGRQTEFARKKKGEKEKKRRESVRCAGGLAPCRRLLKSLPRRWQLTRFPGPCPGLLPEGRKGSRTAGQDVFLLQITSSLLLPAHPFSLTYPPLPNPTEQQ